MTASNHFRVWAALAAAALAVGLLALVEIKPAEAAFPGNNGRIVFQSNRDAGAGEIYSMKPDGSDRHHATRARFLLAAPRDSPEGGAHALTPRYSPECVEEEFSEVRIQGFRKEFVKKVPKLAHLEDAPFPRPLDT